VRAILPAKAVPEMTYIVYCILYIVYCGGWDVKLYSPTKNLL